MNHRSTQRQFIFHPMTVLGVSLIAAAVFALLITLFFDGDRRWFLLYYFVPIGVPFVALLFDRAEQAPPTSRAAWIVDLLVLIPALTRAFVRLPLVSGHALFLSYCLLTARSTVVRLTAFLVLLQVIYLKMFITHDTALYGGILAGCLAALVYRRIEPAGSDLQVEEST